ncbi:MAG: Ig-like domain-containing protein [Actinomycetes bacterium]|jgi:hypothetical protein|nr:Ig-like domain-containing protein [Actinomycetes bacterium]
MLLCLCATPAWASTVLQSSVTPTPTAHAGTWPFNNGDYRESTITYKGKASYYFLTQDVSYPHGSTVYVTFDGKTGTVSNSGVADGDTIFACTVMNWGANINLRDNVRGANRTVFVDGGTYTNTNCNQDKLSETDFALVGITDPRGANPVVIKDTPRTFWWASVRLSTTTNGANVTATLSGSTINKDTALEQYAVAHSGMLWKNLVFDADGYGVLNEVKPASAGTIMASSAWSDNGVRWLWSNKLLTFTDSKTVEGNTTWSGTLSTLSSNQGTANRGQYLITVKGTSGNSFYMSDVVVKNIGQEGTITNPNGAINVIRQNDGQVNLEDIDIVNCGGNNFTTTSYRLVNVNPVPNLNIRNLFFDRAAATGFSQPIWVEYPSSTTAAEITTADVRFDGYLTSVGFDDATLLSKDNAPAGSKPLTYDRLAISSNAYKNVTLPDGYRYAVYVVGTATGTSSYNSSSGYSGQIYVYKSLDDVLQAWNGSSNHQHVVYDLADDTWLVRQPKGGVNVATVNDQLAGINTVLSRLGKAAPTTASGNGRGLVTDAYIKLVSDDAGSIPGFDVPAYSFATTGPNVHIKATALSDVDGYLFGNAMVSDETTADTLVPLAKHARISFDPAVANDIRLYNFDFHTLANYTLHEAVTGGSTETTPAAIDGSTDASFVQCRFTVLARTIDLDAAYGYDDFQTYTKQLGDPSFEATAVLPTGYSSLTTSGTVSGGFAIDDPVILWSSSDTSVASVDICGRVTMVGTGEATITAVARDLYNQTEIPRPSTWFHLTVQAAPTPPSNPTTPTVPGTTTPTTPTTPDTPTGHTVPDPDPLPTPQPKKTTPLPDTGQTGFVMLLVVLVLAGAGTAAIILSRRRAEYATERSGA